MNLRPLLGSVSFVVLLIVLIVAANLCFYTVSEQEQVIITQFGKTVGEPVRAAGFHSKLPFVQAVNRIDKRVLEWDGRASEMPTRDKLYIVVDTFGRWRINDPLQFFTRLRDERSALSRLDDIIGSEVRNAVAKHDLRSQVHPSGPSCKTRGTHELGSHVGEGALGRVGERLVELRSYSRPENRVPQKLQALIVAPGREPFVDRRSMGERDIEE